MNTKDKVKLTQRLVRERTREKVLSENRKIEPSRQHQVSNIDEPQDINNLRDEIKLYQTIVSHKSHPSALNGEWKRLEG
jgi:hypothetical protein